MGDEQKEEDEFDFKFREEEEMEFFTELALHELERWIQAVTKKSLQYPDDTRKSLENGVLLCELLNCIQPGSVNRINRLSTPIAGLDNINVFLRACKTKFGLSDVHLFNPSDLEDLSQRAIAESAYLKQEYDKRLRNVAITIYWLGRYARRHYQGSQLDLSAFTSLIHHRQEPNIVEQGNHPECNYNSRVPPSSSSEWVHGFHNQQGVLESPNESLEDTVSDVCSNMSSNYYNSALSPRNQSHPNTGQEQSHGTYGSVSDLANKSAAHRRYSSTDSLEDSYCSGQSSHSRHGSDSQEVNYPTRRLSTQLLRKQSSITDPLQFIKGKGAQTLAHTAEVQMRVAEESKKGSILTHDNEENADWQSDLSSWKNRRKSHSDRFHSKEQLDEIDAEEKKETQPAPKIKTFSEMQEERLQRMNSRQKFYPIDDDDDDAGISTMTDMAKQSLNSLALTTKGNNQQDNTNKAQQDHSSGDDNTMSSVRRSGLSNYKTKPELQNDTNNNSRDVQKTYTNINSWTPSSTATVSHTTRSFDSRDDVVNKSGDVKEKFWKTENSESSVQLHSNVKDIANGGNSYISSSYKSEVVTLNSGIDPSTRRQEATYQTKEVLTERKSFQEQQSAMPLKYSRNIGSRTQEKIGSILQNFEDSSAKKCLPKTGYNEKVDLIARKKTFENDSENDYRNGLSYDSDNDSGHSHDNQLKTIKEPTPSNVPQLPDTTVSSLLPTTQQPVSKPSLNNANTEDISQGYTRKTIKISQKPNNERGFGFFLSGGIGKKSSLFISKVVLGSAADVCDLKVGDVLIQVNQTDVASMSAAQVGDIVARAVDTGFIEMQVWREKDEDDFDDFMSSGDEEELDSGLSKQKELERQEVTLGHQQDIQKNVFTVHLDQKASVPDKEVSAGGSTFLSKTLESQKENHELAGFEPPAILRKWQQQHKELQKNDLQDEDISIYNAVNIKPLLLQKDSIIAARDQSVTQKSSLESSNIRKNETTEPIKKQEEQNDSDSKDSAKLLEERRAERRARILQSVTSSSSPPTFSVQQKSSEVNQDLHAPLPSSLSTNISTFGSSQPALQFQTVNFVIDPRNRQGAIQPIKTTELPFKQEYKSSSDIDVSVLIEEERKRIHNEELTKIREEKQRTEEELKKREMEEKKRLQKVEDELQKEKERLQFEREKFLKEKEEFIRFKEEQQKQLLQQQQKQQQEQLLQQQKQQQEHLLQQKQQQQQLLQQQQQKQQQEELLQQQQQQQQKHQKQLDDIPPELPYRSAASVNSGYQSPQNNSAHYQNSFQPISKFHSQSEQPSDVLYNQQSKTDSVKHPNNFHPVSSHTSSQNEPGYGKKYDNTLETYSTQYHKNQAEFSRISPSLSDGGNTTSKISFQTNKALVTVGGMQTQSADETDSHQNSHRLSRDDIVAMNKTAKPMQVLSSRNNTDQTQWSNAPIIRQTPSREEIHSLNSVPMARFRKDGDWQNSDNDSNQGSSKSTAQQQPKKLPNKPPLVNKSENKRSNSLLNFGDHWLIEEAERRRIANSEGRLQSGRLPNFKQENYGPIKPAGDSPNRWRDHSGYNNDKHQGASKIKSASSSSMPSAIRQTLLQKATDSHSSVNQDSHSSSHTPPFQYQDNSYDKSLSSEAPPKHQQNQQWQHNYPSEPSYLSTHKHPPRRDPIQTSQEQNNLPITGSQLCSHCDQELGYGAAMVIESLGLFFHVQCFRCWVCHASLGAGDHGTDVRVRINKLHCPNCYSNDEAGLKFSKV